MYIIFASCIISLRVTESLPFVQMARQRYTHRRPLRAGADPEAVIRYYRTYRRFHGDTLAEFVAHYGKLWDEANRYGVRAYEGIIRLIDLFPEEWRGWMTATAELYSSSQPSTYEFVGDMPGFLSAVSAGCFHFGDGPPPATQAPGSERFRRLPPLALMRGADGIFDEGQSSRAPTRKRGRVERGSTSGSSDETESMRDNTEDEDDDEDPEEEGPDDEGANKKCPGEEGSDEDPKEDLEGTMIGDGDTDEEPQMGSLADLGIGSAPPPPVGSPPEIPPPPVEPYPEELQQPFHPVDLTPFGKLYHHIWRLRNTLAASADVPIAPVAAPEPPQAIEIPEYLEEQLSPIEVPHQGTICGDPVWISSDSE